MAYSNVSGQNNSYDFDVKATYSCNSGFDLFGNSARTCTGDGSIISGAFDGEAPSCEGECAQIMVRDNSELL